MTSCDVDPTTKQENHGCEKNGPLGNGKVSGPSPSNPSTRGEGEKASKDGREIFPAHGDLHVFTLIDLSRG